jgi:hypothetical protein
MSKLATVVFVAAVCITIVHLRSGNLSDPVPGPAPIVTNSQGGLALKKFGQDAAKAYFELERRTKLPKGDPQKFKSFGEQKSFLKAQGAVADEDAFGPLADRLSKAMGEKYDEDKLAAEEHKIGQELLDASK